MQGRLDVLTLTRKSITKFTTDHYEQRLKESEKDNVNNDETTTLLISICRNIIINIKTLEAELNRFSNWVNNELNPDKMEKPAKVDWGMPARTLDLMLTTHDEFIQSKSVFYSKELTAEHAKIKKIFEDLQKIVQRIFIDYLRCNKSMMNSYFHILHFTNLKSIKSKILNGLLDFNKLFKNYFLNKKNESYIEENFKQSEVRIICGFITFSTNLFYQREIPGLNSEGQQLIRQAKDEIDAQKSYDLLTSALEHASSPVMKMTIYMHQLCEGWGENDFFIPKTDEEIPQFLLVLKRKRIACEKMLALLQTKIDQNNIYFTWCIFQTKMSCRQINREVTNRLTTNPIQTTTLQAELTELANFFGQTAEQMPIDAFGSDSHLPKGDNASNNNNNNHPPSSITLVTPPSNMKQKPIPTFEQSPLVKNDLKKIKDLKDRINIAKGIFSKLSIQIKDMGNEKNVSKIIPNLVFFKKMIELYLQLIKKIEELLNWLEKEIQTPNTLKRNYPIVIITEIITIYQTIAKLPKAPPPQSTLRSSILVLNEDLLIQDQNLTTCLNTTLDMISQTYHHNFMRSKTNKEKIVKTAISFDALYKSLIEVSQTTHKMDYLDTYPISYVGALYRFYYDLYDEKITSGNFKESFVILRKAIEATPENRKQNYSEYLQAIKSIPKFAIVILTVEILQYYYEYTPELIEADVLKVTTAFLNNIEPRIKEFILTLPSIRPSKDMLFIAACHELQFTLIKIIHQLLCIEKSLADGSNNSFYLLHQASTLLKYFYQIPVLEDSLNDIAIELSKRMAVLKSQQSSEPSVLSTPNPDIDDLLTRIDTFIDQPLSDKEDVLKYLKLYEEICSSPLVKMMSALDLAFIHQARQKVVQKVMPMIKCDAIKYLQSFTTAYQRQASPAEIIKEASEYTNKVNEFLKSNDTYLKQDLCKTQTYNQLATTIEIYYHIYYPAKDNNLIEEKTCLLIREAKVATTRKDTYEKYEQALKHITDPKTRVVILYAQSQEVREISDVIRSTNLKKEAWSPLESELQRFQSIFAQFRELLLANQTESFFLWYVKKFGILYKQLLSTLLGAALLNGKDDSIKGQKCFEFIKNAHNEIISEISFLDADHKQDFFTHEKEIEKFLNLYTEINVEVSAKETFDDSDWLDNTPTNDNQKKKKKKKKKKDKKDKKLVADTSIPAETSSETLKSSTTTTETVTKPEFILLEPIPTPPEEVKPPIEIPTPNKEAVVPNTTTEDLDSEISTDEEKEEDDKEQANNTNKSYHSEGDSNINNNNNNSNNNNANKIEAKTSLTGLFSPPTVPTIYEKLSSFLSSATTTYTNAFENLFNAKQNKATFQFKNFLDTLISIEKSLKSFTALMPNLVSDNNQLLILIKKYYNLNLDLDSLKSNMHAYLFSFPTLQRFQLTNIFQNIKDIYSAFVKKIGEEQKEIAQKVEIQRDYYL